MTSINDTLSAPEAGSAAPPAPPSPRAWWTAAIYIAAVAMFLRFYDLPLKPLHHDEGVNTLFLTDLVRPPHTFRYDPGNYHGPTLFYFGWLSATVFGLTTVAIRLVTAFAGFAAVLLLFLLRGHIGTAGSLAAAALLAVSPGAVYYSRYFIHESLLVCFTVGTVVFVARWCTRPRAVFLYLAAASAGLMFATKETAIISGVVLTAAAMGAAVLVDVRKAAMDGCGSLLTRPWSAAGRGARVAAAELGTRGGLPVLVVALAVFLAMNVLFYTSLFTHWEGAFDAVRAYAVWTRTGTTAHMRPWDTYLRWLSAEELPLLLLGGIGVIAALWRADSRFGVFAALWTLGVLTAYSAIPYKTPWLTLNAIAPLAISAGYVCDLVWQRRRDLSSLALGATAIAAVGIGTFQSVVLSFFQYDNDRYPYVYVHTSREVLELVREIDLIEELNPGASIAVTSREHFPLSWYLRAYPTGYYGSPVVTDDPLVVASEEQQAVLDVALRARYDRIGSYGLRPGVQLVLYVRRDLRRTRAADVSGARPRPAGSP
jgi:uncharacterized protein (TIGR03663 family)